MKRRLQFAKKENQKPNASQQASCSFIACQARAQELFEQIDYLVQSKVQVGVVLFKRFRVVDPNEGRCFSWSSVLGGWKQSRNSNSVIQQAHCQDLHYMNGNAFKKKQQQVRIQPVSHCLGLGSTIGTKKYG